MAKRSSKSTSDTNGHGGENGRGKTLVIVESPAKAKTINKYLGSGYVVKASMGHVRDLPESDYGVDLKNDFRPTYEVVPSRRKVIGELKKIAAGAREVVLATDRDREGEAIAWHLAEALNLDSERTRRIIFNEITKDAIQESFKHPHQIDLNRVNAQQTRRILDRIVGYELSPLLWNKIARGLSAGRVQSVAVRLIVDREREIRAFKPEESWKVLAAFTARPEDVAKLLKDWRAFQSPDRTQKELLEWLGKHGAFRAELVQVDGKPFKPHHVDEARRVVEALGFKVERVDEQHWEEYAHLKLKQVQLVGRFEPGAAPQVSVVGLQTRRTQTRPSAPFTTATLQQAASTRLGFAASRTMRVAQGLYEGVDLSGEGPVGLITYMRTDSTNLAAEAISAARHFISTEFGQKYLPDKPNFYGKRQARAQEAHEAIRPTDPNRTPESLRDKLTSEQFRLYDLIWRRFVACQMPPAEWDSTTATLAAPTKAGEARFVAAGRKLVFDGFMKVAGVSSEDQLLPNLAEQQPVGLLDLDPKQQFTSPPPRYTEASLVKALETDGIGRPSTYASIIDTIQDRGYVEQEERKFFPSSLGELVTDKLVEHFPRLMDIKFTSHMEDELDKVEDAQMEWVEVLNEFYEPFRDQLQAAGSEMEPARSQPSDYTCPTCSAPMVYRWSKSGRFLACSRYPDCKSTQNVNRRGQPLGAGAPAQECELCGKPMTVRQSRSGVFLGCTGYPECRNTRPCDENGVPLKELTAEQAERPCESCGEGTLKVRWRRQSAFLGCDRYPKCKNTGQLPDGTFVRKPPSPPPEEANCLCEKCSRPMVIREGKRGKFIACSGFPKCRNSKPIEKLAELQAATAASGQPVPTLAEVKAQEAARKSGRRVKGAPAVKVDPSTLGPPPAGFAWTRTGRPVVEQLPPEGESLTCPECGGDMDLKRGRFGPFFSCTRFPKCRFNANLRGQAKKDAEEALPAPAKAKPVPTEIPCEECGAPMWVREGRTGKFLGCSAYPKCKSTKPLPPGFEVPEPVGAAAE